jgi:hypothetical protein
MFGDTKVRYEWQHVWRDNQVDERGQFYGHSIWRDAITGRHAIKDMSGPRPDQTDDGVLWLDKSRPVTFSVSDGKHYAAIPVEAARSPLEKSYCLTLWADGLSAARNFGFKIECGEGFAPLARLVMEIAAYHLEKGGNA